MYFNNPKEINKLTRTVFRQQWKFFIKTTVIIKCVIQIWLKLRQEISR